MAVKAMVESLQIPNIVKKKIIINKTSNFSAPSDLPMSSIQFPYYYATHTAFRLKENIMKPYSKVSDETMKEFLIKRLAVQEFELGLYLVRKTWHEN